MSRTEIQKEEEEGKEKKEEAEEAGGWGRGGGEKEIMAEAILHIKDSSKKKILNG